MLTVKLIINKKQFKDVETMYGRLGSGVVVQSIEKALDKWGEATKLKMRTEAPGFTGALKDSIDWEQVRTIAAKSRAVIIGPSDSGSGYSSYSKYHPMTYAYYVETGRGPTDKLANPTDLALRMGLSIEEAFAFANWMKSEGKAKRSPDPFVKRTYNWLSGKADLITNDIVTNMLI